MHGLRDDRRRDQGRRGGVVTAEAAPKLVRADAIAKVTGTAQYTWDLRLPGMLHGAVLRSPHPHARILRIDTARARRVPGVIAVATAEDLAGVEPTFGWYIKDQPIFARDRVRYVGDIVGAVAAVDEPSAMAAIAAIDVDYEPLPFVTDVHQALEPSAPALFDEPAPGSAPGYGAGTTAWTYPEKNVCYRWRYTAGDPDVMASCDVVYEDTFTFSPMQHFHLEPFVCVARATDERLEVWSSNQNPFGLRKELARLFRTTEDAVRVHVPYVGGGFGAKNMCRAEPAAVILSRMTGRPVRMCFTSGESFLTQSQHGASIRLRTGVMRDGTLLARECEVLLDSGAYADASPLVSEKAAYRAPGPYKWRYVDTVASCVLTNKTPAGPFRGFGAPQATWASESQLDMIAARLGIDPYELRMRNLLDFGEPYMPGDSGMDSDIRAGLQRLVDELGYHDADARALRQRDGRGIGLAIGFKDAGGGRKPAAARVVVAKGTITLECGTVELGQGAHTALVQVVAEVLDVPATTIRYVPVDTRVAPFDQGTYASSSTVVMGQAVVRAASAVREQVVAALARQKGASPQAVDLTEWPDWPARLADESFTGDGEFVVEHDDGAALGEQCLFWEYGWGGAEVQVDEETGRFRLTKLVILGDAGRMINPMLCHGQEESSAVMGLGQALFEYMVHVDGELATRDPLSYRVPTFLDIPDEFRLIVQEQGHGPGPGGAKGYGEGGMLVVAAAVANAIADACGARVTELPLSPERVLRAIPADHALRGSDV